MEYDPIKINESIATGDSVLVNQHFPQIYDPMELSDHINTEYQNELETSLDDTPLVVNEIDPEEEIIEEECDVNYDEPTDEEIVEEAERDVKEIAALQYEQSKEGIRESLLAMKEFFMDLHGISVKALSRRTKITKKRLESFFNKDVPTYPTLDEIVLLRKAFDFYEGYLEHRNRKQIEKTTQEMAEIEEKLG